MSYCRFSDMNFRCDVYVYLGYGGAWVTHVASRRRICAPVPSIVPFVGLGTWTSFGGSWNACTKQVDYPNAAAKVAAAAIFRMAWAWERWMRAPSLRLIPKRRITLPFAGQTMVDDSAFACAARLTMLRRIGYRVPDYAIRILLAEGATK